MNQTGLFDAVDAAKEYASVTFPPPRPFQQSTHEALREGRKAGHRCQLIMAPTGSGKTYLGLNIIQQALIRGYSATFVCDRTTLINQTSETADRYGLKAHGIIQADNPRTARHFPFQIASAQSLQSRGWPRSDVIVIDEAHTQLKAWTEHILHTHATVIGLSATPFSKGLGRLFSNLICAATMNELTKSGVLVPLRVYSCTTPDMRGASVVGGEWSDRAAEERGMAIVGDVVTEWVKYGEGRKTICFGATVAHCEELCAQFVKAGIMAALFTGHTKPEERADLLREYSKPNSSLRVLISVEALAKGFDVPDVGCVIDCRPLRKSLSTFIQIIGRGLRSNPGKVDCLARGTLVLTDSGEVPIERITLDHKIWDGCNFVSHGGAICKGVQPVIEYDGLVATPDHEVMTNDGWKRFEDAASGRIRIARTGTLGNPIRFFGDHLQGGAGQQFPPESGGPLRQVQGDALRVVQQHPQATKNCSMPTLQRSDARDRPHVVVPEVPGSASEVQEPQCSRMGEVWRQGDRVPVRVSERGRDLGCGEPRDTGEDDAIGPHRQRRSLRTWESPLGHNGGEPEQHQGLGRKSEVRGVSEELSSGQICGFHVIEDAELEDDGRRDRASMVSPLEQTEREVWDVLNAGPLQRFTANGRLVHNCILLDHSGNIIRFAESYTEVFFNGLAKLDDGQHLDSDIREEPSDDKPVMKCPQCGFKPFARRCMSCGHEKLVVSGTVHEAGSMQEVTLSKGKTIDRQNLFEQCVAYANANSAPDKAVWRAKFLYRDMGGGELPPSHWQHHEVPPSVQVSKEVFNKIRHLNIKRVRGATRAGAEA
jgi:superfamily II DNA or RNA helicase